MSFPSPMSMMTASPVFGRRSMAIVCASRSSAQALSPEPGDSAWAELREAQTMAMDRLPNTGEAVIIDIGEGKDIHPMNKVDVGRRLARWALAKDYNVKIPFHSPRYKSKEFQGNKVVLTFDHVDGGWRPFDVAEPRGFSI